MTKNIYLTIDDGPTKDTKEKLDFLLRNNIPAVLFCKGENLENHEDMAIYAIKNGFIIGNHSYNHPKTSDLSSDEFLNQVKKTDEIIEKIYSKTNIKRPIKLFRFPGGNKGKVEDKEEFQIILKSLGYQNFSTNIKYPWWIQSNQYKDIDIFWTFDIQEYIIEDFKILKNRMLDENPKMGGSLITEESPEEIVLIHDMERTKELFFKCIEFLLELDVKFVSVLNQQKK